MSTRQKLMNILTSASLLFSSLLIQGCQSGLNGTVSVSGPDTTAPTPNPMTFATDPYAVGATSIAMIATTATDIYGVEYYFTCTAGGGNDSGWQDSAIYVDRGLTPETQYTYTVNAGDKSVNQNTTAASSAASATTDAVTAPTPLEEFSIIVLPDTQYYSETYPQHFIAQTQWIKDNVGTLNIKYVFHLGDITDNNVTAEWNNAKTAISILDGQVPYALAPGNHDYGPKNAYNRTTLFLNSSVDTTPYFGTGTPYATQSSIGGFYIEPDGTVRTDNSWHTFSVSGEDFIVIALEFGPRDEVVTWAETVVAAHLNHHAILITHAYMYSDETRYDWATKGTDQGGIPHKYPLASLPGGVNDGEELWQKLVKKYPNFIMTLNGHVLKDGAALLTSTGDHGNEVHQMLCNYQNGVIGSTEGGHGYLRIYTFKADKVTVEVKTYSPVLNQYDTDAQQEFNLQLSPPLSGTTTPPTAPTGLTATAGDAAVGLDWDGSGVASYNVYRSTPSGSYGAAIKTGVSTSDYVDVAAVYETLYYYAVTAVDSSDTESDKSNEAAMILYRGDLTLDGKVDLKLSNIFLYLMNYES
jgi:hypothetical protein